MSGRGKSKRGGKRGAAGGHISTPGGSSTPVSQPTTPITESSTPRNQPLINDSSEINSNSTPSIQEEEPGSSSLLKITPEGDEFIPYDGTKKISSIIKSKYDEAWSDWTNIPVEVKMMWFGEFKKVCTWDLANHEEVVRIFHHKGAVVVRHSLADIRRGKSKGKWLQKSVLSTLQEKWKTDDEFLKKSERNKKNIAANVDGRVNHSGSVSIPESKRRLEKKLGREASIAELFKILNYDKSKDKWHTPASQDAIEKFDKILESKSQNGEEVDKNALFLEVNGGINKKGRSWGFGAAIKCHSSTTSTACSKSKFTPPIPDEVEVLKSRLDSMAEENGQLKSTVNVMQDQLTSVMSLLQKFTGTQLNNPTNEDVPSTSDGDDEDMHADDEDMHADD